MNTKICGGKLKYDGWHLWRCEECGHGFESTGWHWKCSNEIKVKEYESKSKVS